MCLILVDNFNCVESAYAECVPKIIHYKMQRMREETNCEHTESVFHVILAQHTGYSSLFCLFTGWCSNRETSAFTSFSCRKQHGSLWWGCWAACANTVLMRDFFKLLQASPGCWLNWLLCCGVAFICRLAPWDISGHREKCLWRGWTFESLKDFITTNLVC